MVNECLTDIGMDIEDLNTIKLKELGAVDVALYVSHCEDNIQNGDLLKTDLISKIYTTDSILHIEDPKIEVIRNFRK